jgi:ABC-2 type transport system ATP-binding protein
VGFLPEHFRFHDWLNAREFLALHANLYKIPQLEAKKRSEALLELVGLAPHAEKKLRAFSKGMLQRIGLAQALIQEPRLVILDEPTAGVDPVGSRQIRDLILKLRGCGITVFLCSHLLEQVQEVCDHVGIIFQGRMIREGRLEDLIAIEDQTEIVLKDAGPELVERIAALVANTPGASLLRTGKPRTTLERLFLREIREEEKES